MTILVGESEVKYMAHKQMLIDNCPFFAKCLSSGMEEAQTNVVKLPEDDCDAIDQFIFFIYYKTVNIPDGDDRLTVLLKAWVLGDKFGMREWQNKIIDGLIAFWNRSGGDLKHRNSLWPRHVSSIWHARPSSEFAELLRDQLAFHFSESLDLLDPGNKALFCSEFDDLCQQEGFPVSKMALQIMKNMPPTQSKFKYYVHDQGEKGKLEAEELMRKNDSAAKRTPFKRRRFA